MSSNDLSVVLAHGAWADGSRWGPVITALKAESVQVFAAPLPLTSLADAVAALNRSLDRTQGPIVLAGHAYAGAVIALARPERVKALVYVTALAPDEGEKVADLFYRLKAYAVDHIPASPLQRLSQTSSATQCVVTGNRSMANRLDTKRRI